MTRPMTGLASDPRFRLHLPPGAHPEKPERLAAVEQRLEEAGLRARAAALPVRPATRSELLGAHRAAYLDSLDRALGAHESGWLDPDTYFSAGTLEAALLAAGTAVDLAAAVLDGKLENGMALVRPPGHHATADRAMGFCLLNNVAVAAAALRGRGARVAVCDFDVHHGNGTQDIFYDDPRVLFVSSHQYPYYPGSGSLAERGAGAGLGANLNVPLPSGSGDDLLVSAWCELVAPQVERFRPDAVLVSAGFDAHQSDPLAGLRATEAGFAAIVRRLQAAADGRIALVLEGGYDLGGLGASVQAVVRVLLGDAVEAPTLHALCDGERQAYDEVARSLAELPVPTP